MLLPKVNDQGKPYLSYSQIKSWQSKRSFNLGIAGRLEYMLGYFFKEDFGDMGWAEFGQDVENYICYRDMTPEQVAELDKEVILNNEKYDKDEKLVSKSLTSFNQKEQKILKSIETLGVFQKEGRIDFGDFEVLLYIDDCNESLSHIRDYKSASENSSKQYYKDDYWQLDVYGMWVKQETGKLPEKAEVVIVEREGNCFRGGGRSVLKVKDRVWYHDRDLTEERQDVLRENIIRTALEISEYYEMFLKMLKC